MAGGGNDTPHKARYLLLLCQLFQLRLRLLLAMSTTMFTIKTRLGSLITFLFGKKSTTKVTTPRGIRRALKKLQLFLTRDLTIFSRNRTSIEIGMNRRIRIRPKDVALSLSSILTTTINLIKTHVLSRYRINNLITNSTRRLRRTRDNTYLSIISRGTILSLIGVRRVDYPPSIP